MTGLLRRMPILMLVLIVVLLLFVPEHITGNADYLFTDLQGKLCTVPCILERRTGRVSY